MELMLTHRLRRRQASVFRCLKRFKVVVSGRRWGKTQLALWWLIVNAFSDDNRVCYYIAPNYRRPSELLGSRCTSSSQLRLDGAQVSRNCRLN
jgi:hypothetical protein